MSTSPSTDTPSDVHDADDTGAAPAAVRPRAPRADALVLAVAALTVPIETVARAAARPEGWWALASRSSTAALVLLALGTALAVHRHSSARSRLMAVVAVLGGAAVLRTVGALALGLPWFDPLGRGEFVPAATPDLLAVAVIVAAVVGGWHAHRLASLVTRPVAVAVALAGAVLLALVDRPVLAAPASLALAMGITVITLSRRADPDRPGEPSPWDPHLLGTALAALALVPLATRFVLDRYVERTVVRSGVVTVFGPLAPPALWGATVIAAVGVLAGIGLVLIDGWRTGRLREAAWRLVASPSAFVPPVIAIAYLFRIWALYAISTARRDSGDPFFYHVTANILAHGRGFEEPLTWISSGGELPSALHGPGFPAALALVSRIGGVSYVDHQWASIVFGLPQIVFAMLLAHLLAGRRAALLTGAICVVYPNLWLTDGSLFVEGLMAAFTTAATYTLYRWIQRPSTAMIVTTGVLVGLAALTRGEALLLIPLFFGAVVLVLRSVDWRVRWTHALWGTLAAVLTLAPWMLYNAPRFNVFVPLSTNSNEVLFYANCDDVYSGPFIGFWSFACQTRHREEFGEPPGDQAEQAVYWRRLAVEYIKEHRDQVPKVVVARVGRQWELFRPGQTIDFAFIEGRDRTSVRIGQLGYYLMMPLTIAGTILLRRRRHPVLPMWSHAIGVTATAVYAYGTLRFRAPWEPIMVTLAAIGVIFLWDQFRARRPST